MNNSKSKGKGKRDPSLLSMDKPLVALGMDSMRGIQVCAVISIVN